MRIVCCQTQKSTFLKKIRFGRVFFFFFFFFLNEVYVVTNWSTRLENTEQLKFSVMVYFCAFLKVLHFSKKIRDFRNSSVAHAKIVE